MTTAAVASFNLIAIFVFKTLTTELVHIWV